MPEYVSRESLKERFRNVLVMGNDGIMQRIDDEPAADVVEVVRCKDCKNCELIYPFTVLGIEAPPKYFCSVGITGSEVSPNDFCSHGKRKSVKEKSFLYAYLDEIIDSVDGKGDGDG